MVPRRGLGNSSTPSRRSSPFPCSRTDFTQFNGGRPISDAIIATQVINQTFDAFAWLSQIVLFLMLGLLVTPSALLPILGPSLAIAAALMLLARPVAVALCLLPFRYTVPEIALISWVGLRGAVPIFLAIIPVLAGLQDAAIFFGVAFIVVLISLILQGWTVAATARMFDLDVPPLQQVSRLDIDLPGQLGDENTIAGYRVDARCRAVSKAAEALPLAAHRSSISLIGLTALRRANCRMRRRHGRRGMDRNLLITEWDWGLPDKYLHDFGVFAGKGPQKPRTRRSIIESSMPVRAMMSSALNLFFFPDKSHMT